MMTEILKYSAKLMSLKCMGLVKRKIKTKKDICYFRISSRLLYYCVL